MYNYIFQPPVNIDDIDDVTTNGLVSTIHVEGDGIRFAYHLKRRGKKNCEKVVATVNI